MDKILREKFNFKPTTPDDYLYKGTFNNKEVLFLCQVDNFSVARSNKYTAIKVINNINQHIMTIEIKDLGRLTRYNGADIT